jgi:hypothetical protein
MERGLMDPYMLAAAVFLVGFTLGLVCASALFYCPAEQHTQEDDMVTHNDAVTAERERDAARHVARAREIIGAKAEAGDFDIGSTTVGSLILALEALLGLGTAKPGEGEE